MTKDVHINIQNKSIKEHSVSYINETYPTATIQSNTLVVDGEVADKVEGNNLILHYMIDDRRTVGTTTRTLLDLIPSIKSLGADTVTVQLQTSVMGIYLAAKKDKDVLQIQIEKQKKAHEDLIPLMEGLEENGIDFNSFTFDLLSTLPKRVKEKAEYVIKLGEEVNSSFFVMDNILRYTKDQRTAKQLV